MVQGVLGSDDYLGEERNYKLAVHRAISALLGPEGLSDSQFPTLLSSILGEDDPDLTPLGVGSMPSSSLSERHEELPRGDREPLGRAMGSRAVPVDSKGGGFGLGEDLRDAFAKLVDDAVPLPQRVDLFRDELYAVQQSLQQKGGFLPSGAFFESR